MSNQVQKPSTATQKPQQKPQSRPNDSGSFVIQAHMKIFDPQTKRVYVEGRA